MVLTAVNTYPAKGVPGQLVGIESFGRRTYKNTAANVAKVVDVVATVANSTAYTFTVDGVPITYTSDATATAAEIRDGLVAAVTASAFANAKVAATPSGNDVRLTERTPGSGEIAIAESDANLALTVVTAHGQQEALPAGIAVAAGTGDQVCRLLQAGADQIVGNTIHSEIPANQDLFATGKEQYAPNSLVSVMHRGTMLVTVEEAVTPASPVFVRHTPSGANAQRGAFRASADGGTAVQITSAKYLSTAAAGELAEVTLLLP